MPEYVDSRTAAEVCSYTGSTLPTGWNGGTTTVSFRPKFIITELCLFPLATYSWSNGTSTVGSTNPVNGKPNF